MRMRPLSVAVVLLSLSAIGCGTASDSTPVVCREGSHAYVTALNDAPGTVELHDGTPISGCLVENQKAGDLATVGTALVAAATRLNGDARAESGGVAALRLGYLVGAAERGAAGTDGIHADLMRRLTAAARYSPGGRPLSPAFQRAYREGFDAGEARG
jgi:hypothetical protein